MARNQEETPTRFMSGRPWLPWLLVAGLWLFHAIANWSWLSKNVIMRGWDRIGALINSLYYQDTLSQITLQSLFKASIQDEIRPPLFAASMAVMYKLFGESPDVAVMVNVLYMAILLFASYGIGTKLGGWRLGILSAFLVSFTPLVFAMSRYSYFEFSVAAFSALSIYLLLASERFERRGYTLLLGVVLGLGALLKRTFPVFIGGAALVVFLQAGLLQQLWNEIKALPRLRGRHLVVAVIGGLALSALWYFPNQDLARTLNLGAWLFPAWWAIYALTIFFLLLPARATTNFLSCSGLAASVASLWYLPRSSFIQRALRAGWGVNDPRGRAIEWTNLSTWTDYLESILYGFSPVFALLLLLALGLLMVYLLRRPRQATAGRWWNSGWLAIAASVAVSYLILSTSIYKEDRAITPALPLLSIMLAGALYRLPWRRLGAGLAVFAVVFGLIQFFAISFTETHWLAVDARFSQPILGQPGLFAAGPYLERPDSGLNDPGYHISPDVLRRVEQRRELEGLDSISIGILAGSSHVHVGVFAYEQLRSYPAIKVENPVQSHPLESAYSMAFRYDYLLVLNEGSRGRSMREVVDLILGERRPWFEQAFELEDLYPLPDGSEALLFRRRQHTVGAYSDDDLASVAQYLRQVAGEGDMILTYPPGLQNVLLEHYWGPASVSPVPGEEDVPAFQELISQQGSQIFVVTGEQGPMGEWIQAADPSQEQQFGALRVTLLAGFPPNSGG